MNIATSSSFPLSATITSTSSPASGFGAARLRRWCPGDANSPLPVQKRKQNNIGKNKKNETNKKNEKNAVLNAG